MRVLNTGRQSSLAIHWLNSNVNNTSREAAGLSGMRFFSRRFSVLYTHAARPPIITTSYTRRCCPSFCWCDGGYTPSKSKEREIHLEFSIICHFWRDVKNLWKQVIVNADLTSCMLKQIPTAGTVGFWRTARGISSIVYLHNRSKQLSTSQKKCSNISWSVVERADISKFLEAQTQCPQKSILTQIERK